MDSGVHQAKAHRCPAESIRDMTRLHRSKLASPHGIESIFSTTADFVMEGYVDPPEPRREEGPFGPPMEDLYIGGASVKPFLPIIKMKFPEFVDIVLSAEGA
jgi:3-polyprenyl-4-hydroxybenzoate decarboxylase